MSSSSSTTTPSTLIGTRPKILADSLKRIEGLQIDALAYADDIDSSLRPHIDQLIKEELHRMSMEGITASSYLPEISTSSSSSSSSSTFSSTSPVSERIQNELIYIQNHKGKSTSIKDEVLPYIHQSLQKYEKLPSPNDPHLSTKNMNNLETTIQQSQRAIEYQNFTGINLELLATYGIPSWKHQVQSLDHEHKQLQQQNEELLTSINSINSLRKSSQTLLTSKLQNLHRKYNELTETNFYTELACQDMEAETKRLRRESMKEKEGLN